LNTKLIKNDSYTIALFLIIHIEVYMYEYIHAFIYKRKCVVFRFATCYSILHSIYQR